MPIDSTRPLLRAPARASAPAMGPAIAGTSVGTAQELASAFPQSCFDMVSDLEPGNVDWGLSAPLAEHIATVGHARASGLQPPAISAELAADLVHAADRLSLGDDVIAGGARALVLGSAEEALAWLDWGQARANQPGGRAVVTQAAEFLARRADVPLIDIERRLEGTGIAARALHAALVEVFLADAGACNMAWLSTLLVQHPVVQATSDNGPSGPVLQAQLALALAPLATERGDDAAFAAYLRAVGDGVESVTGKIRQSVQGEGLSALEAAAQPNVAAQPLQTPLQAALLERFMAWAEPQLLTRAYSGELADPIDLIYLAAELVGVATLDRMAKSAVRCGNQARLVAVLEQTPDVHALLQAKFDGESLLSVIGVHGDANALAVVLDRLPRSRDTSMFHLALEAVEAAFAADNIGMAQSTLSAMGDELTQDFVQLPSFKRIFADAAARGAHDAVLALAELADLCATFANVVASSQDRTEQFMFDCNRAVFQMLPGFMAAQTEQQARRVFPTPLAAAIEGGHPNTVELLLQLVGAERAGDFCALNNAEALDAAAKSGDGAMFALIFESLGAARVRNIMTRPYYSDPDHRETFRALELGLVGGHTGVVDRLLGCVVSRDLRATDGGARLIKAALQSPEFTMLDRILAAMGVGADTLLTLHEPPPAYMATAIGRGNARALELWKLAVGDAAWPDMVREAVTRPAAALGDGAEMVMDLLEQFGPLSAEQLLKNDGVVFHGVYGGNMALLEALYGHAEAAGVTEWGVADGQALHGLLEGGHSRNVPALIARVGYERMADLLKAEAGECCLHVAIAQDNLEVVEALLGAYAAERGQDALRALVQSPAQSAWSTIMRKYASVSAELNMRCDDTAPTNLVAYAKDARSNKVQAYLQRLIAPQPR